MTSKSNKTEYQRMVSLLAKVDNELKKEKEMATKHKKAEAET